MIGGRFEAAKKQSQRSSSTRPDLIIGLGYLGPFDLATKNVVSLAHCPYGEAA